MSNLTTLIRFVQTTSTFISGVGLTNRVKQASINSKARRLTPNFVHASLDEHVHSKGLYAGILGEFTHLTYSLTLSIIHAFQIFIFNLKLFENGKKKTNKQIKLTPLNDKRNLRFIHS